MLPEAIVRPSHDPETGLDRLFRAGVVDWKNRLLGNDPKFFAKFTEGCQNLIQVFVVVA